MTRSNLSHRAIAWHRAIVWPDARPALAFASFLAIAAIAATMGPAAAQTLGASVQLLDGGQREDGTYLAGLEIDLEPGWKTYWRMPGKGGLPPGFDWSGSSNVAKTRVLWPAPHRLKDAYGDSIGYDKRVVFPIEITPHNAEADVHLAVTGLVGVCERVCVPLDVDLDATLDPSASPGRLTRFLDAVPRKATPEERDAIETAVSDDHSRIDISTELDVIDLFASGERIANGLSEPAAAGHSVALAKPRSGDRFSKTPITLTILTTDDAFEVVLD